MSTINTNTIDANYPIPGQNNSSQGFRDNFASIKQNLDIAGNEITDLQNKAVLKSALANSTINNDMANTLISNAAIQSFRHTMYNLGNALSGTVLINASLADVHYGNIAANTTLNFGSWAPVNTLQTIEVQLGFANANAVVSLPANVQSNTNNYGITLLENYANVANVATFTAPANCTQVNFLLSTTDCGATVYVEPVNRPYQSTQIQQRSPTPVGLKGDVLGTVAVDANYLYVCTGNYTATTSTLTALSTTNSITLSGVDIANTAGGFTCTASSMPLAIGQSVTISGTLSGTGSITGYADPTTYYVIATNGSTTFQLSATLGGGAITTTAGTTVGLSFAAGVNYITFQTGTIGSVTANMPVFFDSMLVANADVTTFGNITAGLYYYVKSVDSGNNVITISDTRTAGVAGNTFALTTQASGPTTSMDATFYNGSNIWKRVSLSAW